MHQSKFIGQSNKIRSILNELPRIASSEMPVLIQGETGTGKELLAEIIHTMSSRKACPLIKVNLSDLSPTLLESELFGHAKGSFTGAEKVKQGIFERAHTGTLFIDEIDDFPKELQVKLLRILESNVLKKVGSDSDIMINIRLITATKKDLRTLVKQNIFHDDLFFRINTIPIIIPPLRDRREDIPLLISHFIKNYADGNVIHFHKEALQALVEYDWHGNAREVKQLIARLMVLKDGEIHLSDLPDEIKEFDRGTALAESCVRCFTHQEMKLGEVLACVEKNVLQCSLDGIHGSLSKIAERLGIGTSTLHEKLKKYNLFPKK